MLVYNDVDRQKPLTLYHQRVEEVARVGTEGSFERYQLQIRPGDRDYLDIPEQEPLAEEVEHFLHCLLTRAKPAGAGEEALKITSVLEACDESIKRNGEAITPPAVR
jgi:predicted dehydrogenase